jgi:RimJ/RimL family protein N-acetyltransferase
LTPRLVAKRLSLDDLEDFIRLHLDPDVSRYLGGVRSREETEAYLAKNMAHWDDHGFGLWTLRTPGGVFVGRAGVRHVAVEGAQEVEVAYALARPFWGQGLASEITSALAAFCAEIALPSLVGVVVVGNDASRRVLEKAGFAFEREVTFHNERCVLYRLRPLGPASA